MYSHSHRAIGAAALHRYAAEAKFVKMLFPHKLTTQTECEFAGSSYAALDTKTEPAGVGATIEASDITNEDQKAVSTI